MQWTEWAALTAFIGAADVAVYAAMARVMRRTVDKQQRETNRQLSAMASTVNALQARVAELGEKPARRNEATAPLHPVENDAAQRQDRPEQETVAVLIAAATTFLGKRTVVRSAQMATAEQSSAGQWAQQGRAFAQTLHNPRSRG
jgi:hypothetical protein